MVKALNGLPLHLALMMSAWQSSNAVSQLANPASPFSKPNKWKQHRNGANTQDNISYLKDWKDYTEFVGDASLVHAIQKEAWERCVRGLKGVQAYQRSRLKPKTPERPIHTTIGNARLLDCGNSIKKYYHGIALCIPSLINRYSLFDLNWQRSFARSLDKGNYWPLVIDWGEPGAFEKGFGCADYVTDIVLPFVEELLGYGLPVFMVGHCMGGLFSLAASQLEPRIAGQVLISTPWDFQAEGISRLPLDTFTQARIEQGLRSSETFPGEQVQMLFQLMHPWQFQKKFARFSSLTQKEKRYFIAIEQWLNEGVPLSSTVAKECLIDWPQHNSLTKEQWRVAGRRITPRNNHCPTLVISPTKDRIVPASASNPLINQLHNVSHVAAKAGHIGAMAGEDSTKNVRTPILKWLYKNS